MCGQERTQLQLRRATMHRWCLAELIAKQRAKNYLEGISLLKVRLSHSLNCLAKNDLASYQNDQIVIFA